MPVSELISSAKTSDDLDKAYASAQKAIAKLGIKIALKKLDAKVGLAMTKAKAAAQFRLVSDRGIIKVQVETTNFSSVLGLLDSTAERDAAKRIVILESLAAAGLVSAAELKAAKAEAAPVVDPTVLKNYLKRMAELAAQGTIVTKLTLEQVFGNPGLKKKFHELAVKEHSTESLDFLAAVDKKEDPKKIVDKFIATNDINLPGPVRAEALRPPYVLDPAYREIMKMLKADTLMRFRASLSDDINKQKAAHKLVGKKAGIPAAQLG